MYKTNEFFIIKQKNHKLSLVIFIWKTAMSYPHHTRRLVEVRALLCLFSYRKNFAVIFAQLLLSPQNHFRILRGTPLILRGSLPEGTFNFFSKTKTTDKLWFVLENGNVLPSRHVAMQVLSALRSLTSVFGMRTGGPPRHYHRYGIITRFLLELSML